MSDEALAVELSDLYKAGRVHLPAVADDYTEAAKYVWAAKDDEGAAFQGGPFDRVGSGGLFGPIVEAVEDAVGDEAAPVWAEVSADFMKILKDTADTLTDCAWALQTIAKQYAQSEGIAVAAVTAAAEAEAGN
ncbi:MAG: hypothetical protein HOV79_31860 [Hamadaea sp.]|nr:hypothetical protein [Hamadaea sp.]